MGAPVVYYREEKEQWKVRHLRMLGLCLVAVFAIGAIAAGSAWAKTKEIKNPTESAKIFDNCPYEATEAQGEPIDKENGRPDILCVWASTEPGEGGSYKVGSITVPITKQIVLQYGIALTAGGERYVPPTHGVAAILPTPEQVPGEPIGHISAEQQEELGWPQALKESYAAGQKKKSTKTVYEDIEVAGDVATNRLNVVFEEETGVETPVKIKGENKWLTELGDTCYIGSNEDPITQHLTSGSTEYDKPAEPPEGWKPIHGAAGELALAREGAELWLTHSDLVDNTYAVPTANCTGPYSEYIGRAIDEVFGLPEPAGASFTEIKGTLYNAVPSVIPGVGKKIAKEEKEERKAREKKEKEERKAREKAEKQKEKEEKTKARLEERVKTAEEKIAQKEEELRRLREEAGQEKTKLEREKARLEEEKAKLREEKAKLEKEIEESPEALEKRKQKEREEKVAPFLEFRNCPLLAAKIESCEWFQSAAGSELTLGNMAVNLVNPITIQYGTNGEEATVGPENGTPVLTPVAESAPKVSEVVGEEATATIELAGSPSELITNWRSFFYEEGTAFKLPVKVKLVSASGSLGESCYVGSNEQPIVLELTPGQSGKLRGHSVSPTSEDEAEKLTWSGVQLVDNTFGVPGVEGCGGYEGALDAAIGLPSAPESSKAIVNGTFALDFALRMTREVFEESGIPVS